MRRNSKAHATVLATVATGALLVASGVASAHRAGKERLKVVGTELQSQFVDVGPPGPSVGDELAYSESLRIGRRDVGVSGINCTVTQVVPPSEGLTFQCLGTLSLRRGQVTLHGLVETQGMNDPGPFRVAITGGTGAYRAAAGEAMVLEPRAGRNIYTLRFDSRRKRG